MSIVKFNSKNGTTLSIDLQQWLKTSDYSTTIVGETDLDFHLADQHQLEATIPKELLAINNIPVIDNQVILSEALYTHHFGDQLKLRSQRIERDLMANFIKIIAHKEVIWSRAEYFLIQPHYLQCGDTVGGGFTVCLGGLLENWFTTEDLLVRDLYPEGDLYIAQLGGSVLNGSYAGIFWSMEKNKFVYKGRENLLPLPGGLSGWLKKMRAIAQLYPYRIENNELAIQKLLSEFEGLKD